MTFHQWLDYFTRIVLLRDFDMWREALRGCCVRYPKEAQLICGAAECAMCSRRVAA